MRLASRKPAKTDARGTVIVRINLYAPGIERNYVKGNLSRSFTLHEAKVSEVYKLIERALKEST